MYQAKQQASDLITGAANWVERLPVGYSIQLRIDERTVKPHVASNGQITECTDLQWHLSGHFVAGAAGSALMLVGPEGEVPGIFNRR